MAELKVVEDEYDSYSNEDLLLIVSCKDEDEDEARKAFDVFYERNAKWLFPLCRQVCSTIAHSDDAEELAKDVFSKTMFFVWENAGKYDNTISKVQTWVSNNARYVMYKTLDEYKGKASGDIQFISINRDESVIYDGECEDYSDVETPEMITLAIALQTLNERERDILMTYMRYSDGNKHLPDSELNALCSRYQITSDNARQIKGRALNKIKKHIINALNK